MSDLSDVPGLLNSLERLLLRPPLGFHEFKLSGQSSSCELSLTSWKEDLLCGKVKPFLMVLHYILLGWSVPLQNEFQAKSSISSSSSSSAVTSSSSSDKGGSESVVLSAAMDDFSFVSEALKFLRNHKVNKINGNNYSQAQQRMSVLTPQQCLTEIKFKNLRIAMLIECCKAAIEFHSHLVQSRTKYKKYKYNQNSNDSKTETETNYSVVKRSRRRNCPDSSNGLLGKQDPFRRTHLTPYPRPMIHSKADNGSIQQPLSPVNHFKCFESDGFENDNRGIIDGYDGRKISGSYTEQLKPRQNSIDYRVSLESSMSDDVYEMSMTEDGNSSINNDPKDELTKKVEAFEGLVWRHMDSMGERMTALESKLNELTELLKP